MDELPISDLSIHGNIQGSINMDNGEVNNPTNDHIGIKYTLPGSLHFLQTEWARFESERSKWDVEKAELEAKVAFLQGERSGQENLKRDLVRRIKMLEYAIKQEREKYNKLKSGDYKKDEMDANPLLENEATDIYDMQAVSRSNAMSSWKQGRQLLRDYLHEIGYTDTIINVRTNRVRQLMGIDSPDAVADVSSTSLSVVGAKRSSDTPNSNQISKRSVGEEAMDEEEQSVMATFNFLSSEQTDSDISSTTADIALPRTEENMETAEDDEETEQVMAEFDFIVGSEGNVGELIASSYDKIGGKSDASNKDRRHNSARPKRSTLQAMIANLESDDSQSDENPSSETISQNPVTMDIDADGIGNSLRLGELAGLTVNDSASDSSYEKVNSIGSSPGGGGKLWTAGYTLRSHFDSVRCLVFHPEEHMLITGSEDHTLKLWNLQKTITTKKSSSMDVEPIATFRGHTDTVLSLSVQTVATVGSDTGATYRVYSGSLDGTVRAWNLPPPDIDPYCSYDVTSLHCTYTGHRDAVWEVSVSTRLLSCSVDGTVKIWNTETAEAADALMHTIVFENDIPLSLDHVKCDLSQFVVGTKSGLSYVYDVESANKLCDFEGEAKANGQVNKIVTHPSLPLTITAHDDNFIRFYDTTTGKITHAMVAHLTSVSSLAIDPNGLYILSGSHDCSIRLWNLEDKSCSQEITSHRKKHDESVHCVGFHLKRPYFASCGADAIAKVFV